VISNNGRLERCAVAVNDLAVLYHYITAHMCINIKATLYIKTWIYALKNVLTIRKKLQERMKFFKRIIYIFGMNYFKLRFWCGHAVVFGQSWKSMPDAIPHKIEQHCHFITIIYFSSFWRQPQTDKTHSHKHNTQTLHTTTSTLINPFYL